MKYSSEVIIDLPLARVIELFDSVENMYKWQPELQNFEFISGEPGQEGSKSRLTYKMGKRDVEMIETITKRNLPHEFAGTYEARGVLNIVSNRFDPIDDNSTRWVAHSEFKFSGIMAIMSLFMKGAFKKQTQMFLDRFKTFAESAGVETV